MDLLSLGVDLIFDDFIYSQKQSDCDSFQRLFDVLLREISKLYPNSLITEEYIFLEVFSSGCAKKVYNFDELPDGRCIPGLEFLSTNKIKIFGPKIEKHLAVMSKAFTISRVFKTSEYFALMDEQVVENSLISCNQNLFDNSLPSVVYKEKEIVSHSISSELFQSSGESSLHQVDPVSSNSPVSDIKETSVSKNDFSIPFMYSIRNNLSEEFRLCDNTSPLQNSDIPCFLPLSDKFSTDLPCNPSCFQLENTLTHSSQFLARNQLQLLMQDWMEITICSVSTFLSSIYQCFLKQKFKPIQNPSESAPDVLHHLKINSHLQKVAFGKFINTILDEGVYLKNSSSEIMLNNRFMSISSRMHGMVLDVSGGKKENGTKVHAWPANKTGAQHWYFTSDCKLESALKDKMYLDIRENKNPKGTTCCISELSDSNSQKWQFSNDGNVISLLNGNVLDIRGSNKNKGTEIILWPNWGGENQRWDIEIAEKVVP